MRRGQRRVGRGQQGRSKGAGYRRATAITIGGTRRGPGAGEGKKRGDSRVGGGVGGAMVVVRDGGGGGGGGSTEFRGG